MKNLEPVRSKKIHLVTTNKPVLYSVGTAYPIEEHVTFEGPVAIVRKPDGSLIVMSNSRVIIDGKVPDWAVAEPEPKPEPTPKPPVKRRTTRAKKADG